jgi:hypothetical protein
MRCGEDWRGSTGRGDGISLRITTSGERGVALVCVHCVIRVGETGPRIASAGAMRRGRMPLDGRAAALAVVASLIAASEAATGSAAAASPDSATDDSARRARAA